MIKFEKRFLYTFADVEEAKKLIGKKGIFFCSYTNDWFNKPVEELTDIEIPSTLNLGNVFCKKSKERHLFFYFDPNMECKRAFYLERKEIQSRVKNSACKDWNDCSRPMWNDGIEYRIKPKAETRLTHRQVAEWLAKGNGQVLLDDFIDVCFMYSPREENDICDFQIRKWSDDDWHEATKEYIEGEK